MNWGIVFKNAQFHSQLVNALLTRLKAVFPYDTYFLFHKELKSSIGNMDMVGLTAILLVAVVAAIVVEIAPPMDRYAKAGAGAFVLRTVLAHTLIAAQLESNNPTSLYNDLQSTVRLFKLFQFKLNW